jgi:hypothetical protein
MVELLELTFPVVPLVVVIVPKSLEEIEVVVTAVVKHLGKLPQFLWATLDSIPLLRASKTSSLVVVPLRQLELPKMKMAEQKVLPM